MYGKLIASIFIFSCIIFLCSGESNSNDDFNYSQYTYLNECPQIPQVSQVQVESHCVSDSTYWTGCEYPTYNQMVSFVKSDKTDLKTWTDDYQCDSFSKEVVKNARQNGYIAGVAFLESYTTYGAITCHYGHDIVCFKTSDEGLYFLEPQLDVFVSQSDMENMYEKGEYYVDNDYGYVQVSLGTETWDIDWFPAID